ICFFGKSEAPSRVRRRPICLCGKSKGVSGRRGPSAPSKKDVLVLSTSGVRRAPRRCRLTPFHLGLAAPEVERLEALDATEAPSLETREDAVALVVPPEEAPVPEALALRHDDDAVDLGPAEVAVAEARDRAPAVAEGEDARARAERPVDLVARGREEEELLA